LLFRRGAAAEPLYSFKHALVRDAAYNSLLRSQRSLRQAQVAQAIERLYADRVEEHLDRLGEHWFAAEAWDKAADCPTRAGQRAASAADSPSSSRTRQFHQRPQGDVDRCHPGNAGTARGLGRRPSLDE
jgi:hypothetical protein